MHTTRTNASTVRDNRRALEAAYTFSCSGDPRAVPFTPQEEAEYRAVMAASAWADRAMLDATESPVCLAGGVATAGCAS